MKTFINLLLFLFTTQFVMAQSSTNAAGAEASGSGGSASYTVGQIDYTAQSATSGSVNQGVQQPYEFFTIGVDEHPEIVLDMTLYPNPTQTHVTLNIDQQDVSDLSYSLYDFAGKLISKADIQEQVTKIPTQNLASATYVLVVLSKDQTIKTFHILKN